MPDKIIQNGFTLIELSIVLVIVGLIAAGVILGQDLISAAAMRAQISQINNYSSAVHSFQLKYNYLPGDMPDPYATQFGFLPRATGRGNGDGNGIIEGNSDNGTGTGCFGCSQEGESIIFWRDLSTAQLIDGKFNTAAQNDVTIETPGSVPSLSAFYPDARVRQGNYIYVWSGGWAGVNGGGDGKNYFGIAGVFTRASGVFLTYTALTVQQAYYIDSKADDGLPMTGRITAQYVGGNFSQAWAAGGQTLVGFSYTSHMGPADPNNGPIVAGDGVSAPLDTRSCYDNGSTPGGSTHYSMASPTPANQNCTLSFQFQ